MGGLKPVQAIFFGVATVCPSPHFNYPPNQPRATMAWAPMAADPSSLLQRLAAQSTQVSIPRCMFR